MVRLALERASGHKTVNLKHLNYFRIRPVAPFVDRAVKLVNSKRPLWFYWSMVAPQRLWVKVATGGVGLVDTETADIVVYVEVINRARRDLMRCSSWRFGIERRVYTHAYIHLYNTKLKLVAKRVITLT